MILVALFKFPFKFLTNVFLLFKQDAFYEGDLAGRVFCTFQFYSTDVW